MYTLAVLIFANKSIVALLLPLVPFILSFVAIVGENSCFIILGGSVPCTINADVVLGGVIAHCVVFMLTLAKQTLEINNMSEKLLFLFFLPKPSGKDCK